MLLSNEPSYYWDGFTVTYVYHCVLICNQPFRSTQHRGLIGMGSEYCASGSGNTVVTGWVWVGECFFCYRPARVVPDKQLLNGCCCCCWQWQYFLVGKIFTGLRLHWLCIPDYAVQSMYSVHSLFYILEVDYIYGVPCRNAFVAEWLVFMYLMRCCRLAYLRLSNRWSPSLLSVDFFPIKSVNMSTHTTVKVPPDLLAR